MKEVGEKCKITGDEECCYLFNVGQPVMEEAHTYQNDKIAQKEEEKEELKEDVNNELNIVCFIQDFDSHLSNRQR